MDLKCTQFIADFIKLDGGLQGGLVERREIRVNLGMENKYSFSNWW